MASITCYYCGKEFKGRSDFRAQQKLRAHLRHCPVRESGVKINVGSQQFLVRVKSIKILKAVSEYAQSVNELEMSDESKEMMFAGYIYCLHQNMKRVDASIKLCKN